ncbi:MAG: DnaJ domain-containing protein [Planctomycetaceae bacterium]|nr:DnaJ domain-containing protein [Planctomycetaceae bacterium]
MRGACRLERDPFDVLGVARDADVATIKRAYRKLAAAHHPDRNPDPRATERLKEVIAAWELLSDPEERRRCRESPVAASATTTTPQPSPAGPRPQTKSRPRPGNRTAASSPRRPRTRAESAAFEVLFREFFQHDADSAADVVLGWLGASACLLALMFYGFQAVTAPFFVELGPQGELAKGEFETGPRDFQTESVPHRRVVDYADARFWTWMAAGACLALTPGLSASVALNAISLLTFWRWRAHRLWWSFADVPDDLRTGMRGCGVFMIWVLPNVWPSLIWT